MTDIQALFFILLIFYPVFLSIRDTYRINKQYTRVNAILNILMIQIELNINPNQQTLEYIKKELSKLQKN